MSRTRTEAEVRVKHVDVITCDVRAERGNVFAQNTHPEHQHTVLLYSVSSQIKPRSLYLADDNAGLWVPISISCATAPPLPGHVQPVSLLNIMHAS